MRFEEALSELRNGRAVYRALWFIGRATDYIQIVRYERDHLFRKDGTEWSPTESDILAEDWEVLSDEVDPRVHAFGFKGQRAPYPVLEWDVKQDVVVLGVRWNDDNAPSIDIPIGLWRRVVADIEEQRVRRGYEEGE